MLNHCTIMGRLTSDPVIRTSQSGIPVCSFSLACERPYKSAGSAVKEVDFVDVVAFRQSATFIANYFRKGRMAVVEGRLQIRSYTGADGVRRRSAEIVADNTYFGDSKPQAQAAPAAYPDGNAAPAYHAPGGDEASAPAYSDTNADMPDSRARAVTSRPQRQDASAPAYAGVVSPGDALPEIDGSDSDLPF